MVMLKTFIVTQITRTRPVVNCANHAREGTTDAACSLDVFGGGFWLTRHYHQAQAININAYRDHISCKHNIIWRLAVSALLVRWSKYTFKTIQNARNINGRF